MSSPVSATVTAITNTAASGACSTAGACCPGGAGGGFCAGPYSLLGAACGLVGAGCCCDCGCGAGACFVGFQPLPVAKVTGV